MSVDKMNPRIARIWCAALDSGGFKQTRDRLRDENGYCCLGVLCELHAQETGNNWTEDENLNRYLHQENYLPKKVGYWAGLLAESDMSYSNPKLSDGQVLSELNDQGKSFAYISNLIKEDVFENGKGGW